MKSGGAIYVAKTKALITCVVIAQLISAFVFACEKIRFTHDATHITMQPGHSRHRNRDISMVKQDL